MEPKGACSPFFWYEFARVLEPGWRAKGLRMLLTVAIIIVLALLLYGFWDWLWHVAMFLALAFLLYQAWPVLAQMRWDDSVVSALQQIHLPPVSRSEEH